MFYIGVEGQNSDAMRHGTTSAPFKVRRTLNDNFLIQNGKPVANQQLLSEIATLMDSLTISVFKIKAHSGIIGNEKVNSEAQSLLVESDTVPVKI